MVVDRFDGGGASAKSGGVVYAGGGTRQQLKAGYQDTPEAMFQYLLREVGDAVSPATLCVIVAVPLLVYPAPVAVPSGAIVFVMLPVFVFVHEALANVCDCRQRFVRGVLAVDHGPPSLS